MMWRMMNMMGFKFTKKRTEKLNACSSLDKLPEEVNEDTKIITFEIEEIVIEHFREDKLSPLMTCI
jgi:hypothetical protein